MNIEPLSLGKVAEQPLCATYTLIDSPDRRLVLRPLNPRDVQGLTIFLEGLSQETRGFHSFSSYDEKCATDLCNSINVYDKLRLVLELTSKEYQEIIGVFMFGFDIVKGDIERYRGYGIELINDTVCRLSPCITDDYQGQGYGSLAMSHMVDIAHRFGQKSIILLGGVLARNFRAIRFYEKNGFQNMGVWINPDNQECLDMIRNI